MMYWSAKIEQKLFFWRWSGKIYDERGLRKQNEVVLVKQGRALTQARAQKALERWLKANGQIV